MIAACPKCGARYRFDAARLGEKGARLRCTRCEAVFRVRLPDTRPKTDLGAPTETPLSAGPRRESEALPSEAEQSREESPDTAPPPTPEERARLVLVATPEAELARRTADALEAEGLKPLLASDGVEAILTIQRMLPSCVILSADLPRMYGFQVCELLKRNESLQAIRVVLIGSVNRPGRYRRAPTDLYGADAIIDEPDLREGLRPTLQRLGVLTAQREDVIEREVEARKAPPAVTADIPAPSPAPTLTPASGTTAQIDADAVAKAERLARIIISDIVLYNDERFASAVERGNVLEAFRSDVEEGRGLFNERIDSSIRAGRDHLNEEILRVARARGMA